MTIEIHVLGAGCDVGRSCILLTMQNRRIILDCGAHPGFEDSDRFPVFHKLQPGILNEVDAILISHYHFDHVGGLPFLTETLSCPAAVYMTEPTEELSRLLLKDFVATSKGRNQTCPYTESDVEKCLERVTILHLGDQISVGPYGDISVATFYAGHAIGGVMFLVQHAGTSVLYSGDYCMSSDGHLGAARVPMALRPDVFITEGTYCNVLHTEGRFRREEELVDTIVKTVQNDGKVLIPIPALGKTQGICSMLSKHLESSALTEVPIYITEGFASKANMAHIKHSDWTVTRKLGCWDCERKQGGKKRSRFNDACSHDLLKKLRPFHRNDHWNLVYQKGPMILFATPGNMSTGISCDVFRVWSASPKNLVVMPGFLLTNVLSSRVASEALATSDTSVPDIRCQTVNQISHIHSDKRGILRMCRQVQAKRVVLVHGEKKKLLDFKTELGQTLGVPCYAPEIGESLRIDSEELKSSAFGSGGVDTPSSHTTTWSSILSSYERFTQRSSKD